MRPLTEAVARPRQLPSRASRAWTLLLVVALSASQACGRPTGCHSGGAASGRRRLLQNSASAVPGDVINSTSVIETVEVDVVSQECVILTNAYYETTAEGVEQLVEPADNLHDSPRACCSSCHDLSSCNAWQWCPLLGGCQAPDSNITFPYHGCQLIDLSGFLLGSVNTGQIKQAGANVPFSAGSPLFFSVPKLSGYDVEIGRNFGGKFNYTCPMSLTEGSCVVQGSAQEIGMACDSDALCLAFTFYPKGGAFHPSVPYGVLKGGDSVRLTTADTELNPNAAIYIKLQPLNADEDSGSSNGGSTSSSGGGGSNDSAVVAAVVSSVLGTAAVATAVLVFFYLRYRRLKASVADGRPPADSRNAGSGGRDDGSTQLAAMAGSVDGFGVGGGIGVVGRHGSDASASAGGSSASHGHSASSDTSNEDHILAAAIAASQFGGSHKAMRRTSSPPSVVDAAQLALAGGGGGSGGGGQRPMPAGSGGGGGLHDSFSPFLVMSPQELSAAVGATSAPGMLEVTVVDVSRSSSGGSWQLTQQLPPQLQQQQQQHVYQQQQQQQQLQQLHPAAAAWQAAQQLQQQQQMYRQQPQQAAAWQQQQEQPVVVEVQRTVGDGSYGAGARSGSLPPSLQAGTARELLEVFARMYSQRPAVDYEVVAQMLDQDADPDEVAAAESADEERLRRVDSAATQQRLASHAASPSSRDAEQQQPRPQQHGALLAAAQAAAGVGALPSSGVGGGNAAAASSSSCSSSCSSSLAHASPSLLPGMHNPESSLLPPGLQQSSLQPEEVEICKRPDGTYWQLGTGAFGTCYKGLYHSVQLVAVKVLHRVEERRRGEEFEREVALLKDLQNRNIVQFIGACLDGPTPMLVTEFMEFGDLWRALPLKNAANQRIFAWRKRGRRVLYDVAKGLLYLHQRRIVHLDLKSANILLSRHGTAKICDIGMARVLGNKEYLSMLSGMGTFAWSAPEVLSGKRCTEKVDLYSFGVVIWEVCTGDVPVRGEMRQLTAPADCPQAVLDLYERCISELPEQRPTAQEVVDLLGSLL